MDAKIRIFAERMKHITLHYKKSFAYAPGAIKRAIGKTRQGIGFFPLTFLSFPPKTVSNIKYLCNRKSKTTEIPKRNLIKEIPKKYKNNTGGKDMKTWNMIKMMAVMMAVLASFSSCQVILTEEDMDVHKSIKFAGQWTGDFGMYYSYRYNGRTYTFDSYDTDIVFYPEYDGATWGYGKQVDYYERGPYSRIYNSFDWEIRNGVVYLRYYNDSGLDCAIYDYVMTNDRFQGRFGSSNDRFYLSKIADYYDWSAYMDHYYYYPNYGWHWSVMFTRAADNTAESNVAEATSSTVDGNAEGIVSFGKRF